MNAVVNAIKDNKVLVGLVVVSFILMILASLAIDPVRKMRESLDKGNSPLESDLSNIKVTKQNVIDAHNAGSMMVIASVLVLVGVIVAIVLNYRHSFNLSNRLRMRFI